MKWITAGFMKIWFVLSFSPASIRFPKTILRQKTPSKFLFRWKQLCRTAARSRKRGADRGANFPVHHIQIRQDSDSGSAVATVLMGVSQDENIEILLCKMKLI